MALLRSWCVLAVALVASLAKAQTTFITDLGSGLAGSMGPALHTVHEDGGYLHFTVQNVPPESNVILVVGLSAIWLPIFGGILVPSPDVTASVTSDTQGRATYQLPTPSMTQLTIFSQFGFPDVGTPGGMAISNAMMVAAVECADVPCPRSPQASGAMTLVPATDQATVEFKLTGGSSGWCPTQECTGTPCSWTFALIVDNKTAGPGTGPGTDPGATITFEVRTSLTFPGATPGATEFQAASPEMPPVVVQVPTANPAQGQRGFSTTVICGSQKNYLIKVSAPAYSYQVPAANGDPPQTVNVPALEVYANVQLQCTGC
jgi:hypothetical protein